MNWIIVVAGGKGERMDLGFNKIFAKLGKLPVIYWTLKAFEGSNVIDKIIISASSDDMGRVRSLVKKYRFKKVLDVVVATASRQDSTLTVLKVFKSMIKKGDLVGVHNGVNPFVSDREIKEVFKSAKKYGAAILAQKARDTVKISSADGLVVDTPVRQYSWYAQTPQVATFENLYKAHIKAKREGFIGTDDAQLLERIGVAPKIVATSNLNFKITFREDLIMARYILKKFLMSSRI